MLVTDGLGNVAKVNVCNLGYWYALINFYSLKTSYWQLLLYSSALVFAMKFVREMVYFWV